MKINNALRLGLYVILILLIGFGILLRSIEVINGNYLWGFDHGREYLMVQEIVNGNFRLIGAPLGGGSAGIEGIFHGPGYFYFLAVPYILFQGDPYGGVVLMFLFGVGTILVSFLLAKKMFGLLYGLIAAALVSLSPPLISQSRAIWSPFPSTFFVVLSFYFTYLFTSVKKRKNLYIFLASFFAGFVYHFELAIAVPLTIGLIGYSIFIFKKKIKPYLFLVAGFVIAYLPMILFEVRHSFMAVNGIIKYLTNPVKSKGPSFIENIVDHWGSFIYNVANSFPEQTIVSAYFILGVLLIGIYYTWRNKTKKNITLFIRYLLFFPIITFIVFIFLRNTVYQYYLFHLVIVYILVFVYLISSLVENKQKIGIGVFGIMLVMFFIAAIPQNIKMFAYDIKDYGGDAKIKGKKDAIDFIYKDAMGKNFNLLVFSPPVYTYPYDYLLDWHAKKKYGYLPGKEKTGTFYLLIEVDPAKTWSYNGWLETEIKEGDVIWEKKLPSGFIVQKRFKNE